MIFIQDLSAKKLIIFLHGGLGSIVHEGKLHELIYVSANSYGLVYDRHVYRKNLLVRY